jgi:hypothetical protein
MRSGAGVVPKPNGFSAAPSAWIQVTQTRVPSWAMRAWNASAGATRTAGPAAVSPSKRCSHTPTGWLNLPPVAV